MALQSCHRNVTVCALAVTTKLLKLPNLQRIAKSTYITQLTKMLLHFMLCTAISCFMEAVRLHRRKEEFNLLFSAFTRKL